MGTILQTDFRELSFHALGCIRSLPYVPRSGEAYRSLDSGHGGNPIARSLASLSTS
jgi:hypothetical protein